MFNVPLGSDPLQPSRFTALLQDKKSGTARCCAKHDCPGGMVFNHGLPLVCVAVCE